MPLAYRILSFWKNKREYRHGNLQLTMSCKRGRDIVSLFKTVIANRQAQQEAKPVDKQLEMGGQHIIQVKRENHVKSHLMLPIMKWNFYDKKSTLSYFSKSSCWCCSLRSMDELMNLKETIWSMKFCRVEDERLTPKKNPRQKILKLTKCWIFTKSPEELLMP